MKMLPISDIAKELGWSRQKVIRALDRGELKALCIGTKRVIDIEQARELAQKQAREGIGIDALSTLTGLAVGAIRQGVSEGWIPHWRAGRAFRFDGDEVIAAIVRRIEEQNT